MGLAQLIKYLTALNIGTGPNSGSYAVRAAWASLPAASSLSVGQPVWSDDKPTSKGGSFEVRESSGTPGTYIYDRVGGGPIVHDTLANCLSGYNMTTYDGCTFRCTDIGESGSDWYASGGNINPKNPITIKNYIDGYARAPSGTINAGSSGNITFGTAAPRAYTEGLYVYLPAIATTPAIASGWYWCVMSNTTTGTLYSSKGGAAINFTVGASYTGVTTDITHPGFTIVANSAKNRRISVVGNVSATNNANTKILQIYFNGSGGPGNGVNSVPSARIVCDMYFRGTSVQIIDPAITGYSGSNLRYFTEDITSSDRQLTIKLNSGSTATDWVVFESLCATMF